MFSRAFYCLQTVDTIQKTAKRQKLSEFNFAGGIAIVKFNFMACEHLI